MDNKKDKATDSTGFSRSGHTRKMSESLIAFIVALIIGLITGVCAYILKLTIDSISRFLTQGMDLSQGNWRLLILPLAGIILTSLYVHYIAKERLTHGTSCILSDIAQHKSNLGSSLIYSPIIGCSLTLGFGGSAGSEGPIAYTGAAIGSNIGKLFRVNSHIMMILLGCGAGAGIAAIFKAPVGGMLFTLEVLRMELTTLSALTLLTSCLTAALTAYILSGCTVDMALYNPSSFDVSALPYIIMLGVFCGIYSLYYSGVMKRMDRFWSSMSHPWIKHLSSGIIISGLVFLFPAFYGEGYSTIGEILNGHPSSIVNDSIFFFTANRGWGLIAVTGIILLLKSFMTSATNSGGGVGGDFAPTLFAGCMAGLFFTSILNQAFGLGLDSGNFAYFAMAGVMAGAIHAPLMAIFLTVEMTGQYTLLLPLTIDAAISYGIVRFFDNETFYVNRIKLWRHHKKANPRNSASAHDGRN